MADSALGVPLLRVQGLQAWYGESHILHGVDFEVRRGEVVTLLGRNGVGKTTTLKSIMGIVGRRQGSVVFDGTETIRLPSNRIARLGIAFCPEERGIFASLNVLENLLLPPKVKESSFSVERIYELFPNLKERQRSQGTKLSGGEQQMLAIARILRTGASLLLLDEPTEGLAPVIVQQIGRSIRKLKEEGLTVLLVEQNFRFAQTVADRHYVIGLANAGADTITAIKQGAEFGIAKTGQQFAGLLVFLTDVHALGLDKAQGLLMTESFYWDLNDQTRGFSRRFAKLHKGAMPTMGQAGVYSAVLHYLKPVAPTISGASRSAHQYDSPNLFSRNQAQKAPIMYWAPCAKLMMFSRPKITARPNESSA